MTHRKQIRRLEEQFQALVDAQVDMAQEGFSIDNYERIISHMQGRYSGLTGRYYQLRQAQLYDNNYKGGTNQNDNRL